MIMILGSLEFPVMVVFHGLDGPVEFLAQSLREELLNRNVKLLCEDYGETGINIVLENTLVSKRIKSMFRI